MNGEVDNEGSEDQHSVHALLEPMLTIVPAWPAAIGVYLTNPHSGGDGCWLVSPGAPVGTLF